MDPCSFVRIFWGNLALKFPDKTHLSSLSFFCKFKLKGLPTQVSDVTVLAAESGPFESKFQGCLTLRKAELENLMERSSKSSCLKCEVYRRGNGGCGFANGSAKLLGCVVVPLDLRSIMENNRNNRRSVIQNGWVSTGSSGMELHLNVRAEPDPRFVFRFDGEPECSPQVFQVNGHVQQPVFTCKFGFRNSGDRISRSRSSLSEPSTSTSCLSAFREEKEVAPEERKGWSITVHDLSGSPVAAASMVTPFVPSPGTNSVSKSNPGAWLILRPGHSTFQPWGRLEAWHQGKEVGYRFELIPDDGMDSIRLANSSISIKHGGTFSIDISNGPTPITSPNSSFDLSSGSGSELGSTSGSGSWANFLYRGFVMSSSVEGNGKCSKPEVEVGAQHVTCTEDAAVFVALAAAMDLSMDACKLFPRNLRKELRQVNLD
ncbi:hypothetical protein F511_12888 [Dorcoceras hygrometricum]|uniref:Formin-like protein 18 n=1 Tax=Dorcoceras hygrometricum TaxID=472368 RepID=A0A2Z7CZ38_9LAMI|nr:hypothetical protein F511_12888 [Dorcoceras hygrometricum]